MGYDIQAAAASKTDEPHWADICLRHLAINKDGKSLNSYFQDGKLVEIDIRSKTNHFKRLHKKTGVPYEQMAFFDNEYGNIRTVSGLGVKCYYTPDGMTKDHWDQAKADFDVDIDVCKTSLN